MILYFQQNCENYGGRLLILNSKEEMDFIYPYVVAASKCRTCLIILKMLVNTMQTVTIYVLCMYNLHNCSCFSYNSIRQMYS